jgi:hypothetical protein
MVFILNKEIKSYVYPLNVEAGGMPSISKKKDIIPATIFSGSLPLFSNQ